MQPGSNAGQEQLLPYSLCAVINILSAAGMQQSASGSTQKRAAWLQVLQWHQQGPRKQ
jgi:hypothetical protein